MWHKEAVVFIVVFYVRLLVAVAVLRTAYAFTFGLIFPLIVRIYFVVYVLNFKRRAV
jgi:hypothetical protein